MTEEQVTESTAEHTTEQVEEDASTGSLFATGPDQGSGTEELPAQEETSETLYAEKYKSVEELEKGYQHLQQKMQERGTSLDDDTLKELATERGLVNEAPESYDIETAMKDAGLDPLDPSDNAEQYEQFAEQLKEHGFNQNQVNFMMELGASWVQEQINRLGPEVDIDSEREKITEEWGDKADERSNAIAKWAQANLPSDVYTKPLYQTAEGMKILHSMMSNERGAQPIQQGEREPKVDTVDLNNKVNELMQSDSYKNPMHPEYTQTQKRVYNMLDKLKKSKR